MQVSFVIPLYNCLPLTQAMVASLQATLPRDLPHEIILVDDGSTDGTREWLATLGEPFRVILNERNLGYAAANNRAVAAAGGELLVLLNNDLVLTPGWLAPMLAAHHTLRERAGVIGNVQLNARTGKIDHTGIFINGKGKPEHSRTLPPWWLRSHPSIHPVEATTGACLLVARALWGQLGGFDENYRNGCEDVDLCFRARAAGRTNAVALRSVVLHHVSSSPGRKLHNEENTYRLARRWRGELAASAARHWCRHYYESIPLEPSDSDHRFELQIWLYALGLRRSPPSRALAAMSHVIDRAIGREIVRWQKTFDPSTETRVNG